MDVEFIVAQKYGLFWAGAFTEEDAAAGHVDGCYIYMPIRFWEPFWLLFDRLAQLNDYCFNQLVASETKLIALKAERDRALGDKNEGAETLDFLSEAIPAWEDNLATFSKAAPVVLLASFTEWGLKHIAENLFGAPPNKRDRRISDIQFYVLHLIDRGLEIKEAETLISRLELFRTTRNKFAHGRWTELEQDLRYLNLREAFAGVSAMFEAIEDAAWRSETSPA